jgi:hypothetical protein
VIVLFLDFIAYTLGPMRHINTCEMHNSRIHTVEVTPRVHESHGNQATTTHYAGNYLAFWG